MTLVRHYDTAKEVLPTKRSDIVSYVFRIKIPYPTPIVRRRAMRKSFVIYICLKITFFNQIINPNINITPEVFGIIKLMKRVISFPLQTCALKTCTQNEKKT